LLRECEHCIRYCWRNRRDRGLADTTNRGPAL